MAKILTVEQALRDIRPKKNTKGELVINRFNKKKFENLLLAILNDTNYTTTNVKIRNGEIIKEEVEITKNFRKFCKKILECAGIDKTEAARIESDSFSINNVDGLYEFFSEIIYLYMESGNQFDFPNKEDFKGGIQLIDVEESTNIYKSRDLAGDGRVLGEVEKKTKKHKRLKAKSSAPSYLSSKRIIK